MLTFDDLDHFDDRSAAQLFAPATQRVDADMLARRARILACLKFCRNISDRELVEGGLHTARRVLKSVRRSQQRKRRLDANELTAALEGMQLALGELQGAPAEPTDIAPERHAVEAEIQATAVKLMGTETCDADLMASLAQGEFEILPFSNSAPLTELIGRAAETVNIDVDLSVDGDAATEMVRVHLVVESGYWRWTAQEGCCMSRNGNPALFLLPDDGVVQAILSGLALRSGRAIAAWAKAVDEHSPSADAP